MFINLGRGPDGKCRAKTYTAKGTKAQAQRRLRELLTDLDRGVQPPDRILLVEWFQRWLAERVAPNLSIATYEWFEGIVRLHIAPALGHIELAGLRTTLRRGTRIAGND